jgi:broad specificity phosphatase PhoE
MAIIYLLRHGRTDFLGKILCGNTPGIHLNEEGREQAQKAADYLGNFPIKAVYSSPMERACETAAPLAKKLNLEVIPLEFLREINFGDFQGKGEELLSNPIWQKFSKQPGDVRFPNGESVVETQQRVGVGLDHICRNFAPEDQLVFTAHCEVLRLAVAYALNLPLDDFLKLTIDPASISKLEWSDQKKKLLLLNFVPN